MDRDLIRAWCLRDSCETEIPRPTYFLVDLLEENCLSANEAVAAEDRTDFRRPYRQRRRRQRGYTANQRHFSQHGVSSLELYGSRWHRTGTCNVRCEGHGLSLNGRRGEEIAAMGGQGNLPCRAIEKPEAQLPFQFPDQDAEAGRCEEHALRRPREALVFRDEMKGSELAGREFHY